MTSTRGQVEAAEPEWHSGHLASGTSSTPAFLCDLGKSLSFWASASLFTKWRGLLPFFLCLLEKQKKKEKHKVMISQEMHRNSSIPIIIIKHQEWVWRLYRAAYKTSSKSHDLPGPSFYHVPRKSTLNIHWKDWCWSWSSNTLATWLKGPTHWKRPWWWERLMVRWEGDNKGWDGWMASLIQ